MDPSHSLTEAALFSHAITDMANALSIRSGEAPEQRFVRVQVATHLILGFMPRGVIEVMLAGHVVMFHTLITDSASNTLRGEVDAMRRSTRGNIVAMNRAFHLNLDKLERYQSHASEAAGQAEQAAQPPDGQPLDAQSPDMEAASVQTAAASSVTATDDDTARPSAAPLPPALLPSTQGDAQTSAIPPGALPLNRAQRRKLLHGRVARQG